MANVTYDVVAPFMRDKDGMLTPGEAKEVPNSDVAKRRAYATFSASGNVGAAAFSRTGDPESGEFGEGNPWQFAMGQAVEPVLKAMGVIVLRAEQPSDVIPCLTAAITMAFQSGYQVAVLLTQRLIGAKRF